MEGEDDLRVDLSGPGGRHFVAACYEMLLGRELEITDVAEERGGWPRREILRSVMESGEFVDAIRFPLEWGASLPAYLFTTELGIRHRLWATDLLPLLPATIDAVWGATGWRTFLLALLTDEQFMAEIELPPLDPSHLDRADAPVMPAGDDADRGRVTILGADLSKQGGR